MRGGTLLAHGSLLAKSIFTLEIQRIEAHMSSVFDFATSIKSVSQSVLMAMLTHNFLTKFTIFCLHSSFLLSLFPRSL